MAKYGKSASKNVSGLESSVSCWGLVGFCGCVSLKLLLHPLRRIFAPEPRRNFKKNAATLAGADPRPGTRDSRLMGFLIELPAPAERLRQEFFPR